MSKPSRYEVTFENPKGKSKNYQSAIIFAKNKLAAYQKIGDMYGVDSSEILSCRAVATDSGRMAKGSYDDYKKHDSGWEM